MRILISQKTPSNIAAYEALKEKYGVDLEFHPFFRIEPVSSKEFRAQRINLQEYTAVVFSSRYAIDAYFKLCEEMRFKVPETMKYFCTTEMVAIYLQKHVVYRKRKIFFGDGTPQSVLHLVGPRHKGEKFLITTSDNANCEVISSLFSEAGLDYAVSVLVKSVPCDLSDIKPSDYSAAVIYSPYDVASLLDSFPDFKPEGLKFICYGKSVVRALEDAGLEADITAGSHTDIPSVVKAIELFIQKHN